MRVRVRCVRYNGPIAEPDREREKERAVDEGGEFCGHDRETGYLRGPRCTYLYEEHTAVYSKPLTFVSDSLYRATARKTKREYRERPREERISSRRERNMGRRSMYNNDENFRSRDQSLRFQMLH